MICQQYPRRQINSVIFWQKKTMSIWRLVCCSQIIAVVLFLESMFSIFIIFNPIAKILIFRESVIRYAQERVSKTTGLLDFPLRLLGKYEGKSSKSAVFDTCSYTYRVTESRRIKIFAIGLKIMKIQNLLSWNNTTAMSCAQHTRRQIDIVFFYKKVSICLVYQMSSQKLLSCCIKSDCHFPGYCIDPQ